MGHVLNMVLKDAFVKFKRLQGFHCPLYLGWDCHGLPVEFRVTQELQAGDSALVFEPSFLRQKCRESADHWSEHQMNEFKELGLLADWKKSYFTMDSKYEADTLRVFGKFVEKGFVEWKLKTVSWCTSCQTTLSKVRSPFFSSFFFSFFQFFSVFLCFPFLSLLLLLCFLSYRSFFLCSFFLLFFLTLVSMFLG